MQFRRVLSVVISVAIIGGAAAAVLYRQDIYDWYRLRNYQPSNEISSLAENAGFSEHGKKLFYVHDPLLEDREQFNQSCNSFEQTIVLGCYKTHRSIHIYDVKDERLQGIREVTAAHEMLHAAYDRLSSDEKATLDSQLMNFYDAIKADDERLRETVEGYEAREPDVVPNELHSIIGTEVRELTPELGQYYGQYFTDRSKVVDLAEGYAEVFVEQREAIERLRTQINALEADLQARREQLRAAGDQIDLEARRLNQLLEEDRVEEYNAAVPSYNAGVQKFRSQAQAFNDDVERLNGLIKEFNALAVEQKELNSAIDSHAESL
jgi:outer membrane murein-binding lipoprotein Lpp